MSVGPASPLRRTLIGRREQLHFRLVIGVVAGCCFGQLLGWFNVAAWIGTYAILQGLELACFFGRRPVFATRGRGGTAAALTLLAASSAAFGALEHVRS